MRANSFSEDQLKSAEPSKREEFIAEQGFSELIAAERMPGKFLLAYSFEREDHTRSVYTIAKFLTGLSRGKESTLVSLHNMYVWPSGRDEHLIKYALASIIEMPTASLNDGTAILWTPTEEAGATTLYHLALLFGWDAYIFPKGGGVSGFISHDGFVELYTDNDPAEMAAIAKSETTRTFGVVDKNN